jgi:hypothetical protein
VNSKQVQCVSHITQSLFYCTEVKFNTSENNYDKEMSYKNIGPTDSLRKKKNKIINSHSNILDKKDERNNNTTVSASHHYFLCTVWVTVDIPSTNFVRNSTLALLNIPSFRDTMINCKGKYPS